MFCANCGREIKKGNFCPYCGHRHDRSLLSYNKITTASTTGHGGKGFITGVFVSCAVVAVIIGIMFFATRETDEEKAVAVAQRYFDAVKSGDTAGAFECFTPTMLEQVNAGEKLGGMIGSKLFGIDASGLFNAFVGLSNANAYENYEFKATYAALDSKKSRGTVDVEVYIDGSLDQTTSVSVVKYNGKWYIEN